MRTISAFILAITLAGAALLGQSLFRSGTGCCTYYVDNAGSDSANGKTPATAWQTIAKVNATTLTAGQSVGFKRGGTWRETLTPGQSGSAGSPITFAAYGSGAKPIISGAQVLSSWTLFGGTELVGDNGTNTGFRAHNIIYWNRITTTDAGTLTNYNIHFGASPSPTAKCALYADNSNAPGSLIASSDTGDFTPSASAWTQVSPGGSVSLTAATNYWIGFWLKTSDSSNGPLWTNSGLCFSNKSTTYGTWPDPVSSPTVNCNSNANGGSFYINVNASIPNVYTATASATPTQLFANSVLQTAGTAPASLSESQWYASGTTVYYYENAGNPGSQAYTLEASVRANCVWLAHDYLTVDGVTCQKAGMDGIYLGTVADTLGTPASTTGGGITVRNSIVTQGYASGIRAVYLTSQSAPINILNNEVSYNGLQCETDSCAGYYDGIETQSVGSAANPLNVIGNNSHHNPWGMEVDQTSQYAVVTGNWLHDNEHMGFNNDRADHTTLAYNVIANNGNTWEVAFWSATHSTSTGNTIANNTIRGNSILIRIQDEQTGLTVENNIASNSATTATNVAQAQDSLTYSGLAWDYNLYYPTPGTNWNYGSNFYAWTGWKGLTIGGISPDAGHGLNVDPLFTNGSGNYSLASDFTLQGGSPAIGAGVYIAGVSTANPPNIGAK